MGKTDYLRMRIRDALRSDDFQRTARGLSGALLSKAIVGLFQMSRIRVQLISVGPADKAALADFGAVWKSTAAGGHETTWFNLKPAVEDRSAR